MAISYFKFMKKNDQGSYGFRPLRVGSLVLMRVTIVCTPAILAEFPIDQMAWKFRTY